MIDKLRARLASDEGFTLIELLVVIIIIGILLAIAVPSYLGFRTRANESAAQANVRAAIPTAEAYYADNGSYTSMDLTAMKVIDQGLSSTLEVKVLGSGAGYCLADHSGTSAYYVQRGSDGATPPVAYDGKITKNAGWSSGAICP